MRILVFNCGSSSLKFRLFAAGRNGLRSDPLLGGVVERIGMPEARLDTWRAGRPDAARNLPVADHDAALHAVLDWLDGEGVLARAGAIHAVGHRIVHGGEEFRRATALDEDTARKIAAYNELAPLHNPVNLQVYAAARRRLPRARQVAVFDTAFHHTLPARAYLYGLPWAWREKERIRRYGFHGISHGCLMRRYAALRRQPPESFKLITCHLGNGCSICAIDRGKSVDTTMGFTPLEGLIMGSRSGDIGPGTLLYILKHFRMTPGEAEARLNHESGMAGIAGVAGDMRELLRAIRSGNQRALLAVEAFCYRIALTIGAYHGVLGGADAVIFSGGIGEHAPEVRARVCGLLPALLPSIDQSANANAIGKAARLSAAGNKPEVWVIPTDEERGIAEETLACLQRAES